MRFGLYLLFYLLFTGLVLAQENPGLYETALQRIEEAQANENLTLDLSALELTSLPPEIGQLVNLEQLSLQDNQLTSLPSEIANLRNLRYLQLKRNQLTSLPPEIGQLVNLEMLDLSENELSSLPPEIVNLGNLCLLNLILNHLESLPDGLEQLPRFEDRTCRQDELLFALHGGVLNRSGLRIEGNRFNEPFWSKQSFIAPAVVTGTGLSAVVILGIFWWWRHKQQT